MAIRYENSKVDVTMTTYLNSSKGEDQKRTPISFYIKMGLIIRLAAVIYGELHGTFFPNVKYTDIDYEVFSDAASHVASGRSPYERQGYRYSPILAYMLIPNTYLHPTFGKLLFSVADVLVGLVIFEIVRYFYGTHHKAIQCAKLWFYNPLPVVIATRGNADAVTCLLILMSLLYHLKGRYLLSGLLLGLSTHMRLYPVLFLFPMFLTVGSFDIAPSTGRKFFVSYKSKLSFLVSFLLSLGALTYCFYAVYNMDFINNAILYHLERIDFRHNFSVHFLSNYLNLFKQPQDLVHKVVSLAPQALLLVGFSLKYGEMNHLPFCLFCISYAFVTLNKVITCQYYLWYLSLLPVFLPSIKLETKKVIYIIASWIWVQLSWLASAYYLEFLGEDKFSVLWIISALHLLVNMFILVTFVNRYNEAYSVKHKYM